MTESTALTTTTFTPMSNWITDRLPTEADGDADGDVAALFRDGTRWLVVPFDEVGAGQPWMPFPPTSPSVRLNQPDYFEIPF